jgi:hypothetical protein
MAGQLTVKQQISPGFSSPRMGLALPGSAAECTIGGLLERAEAGRIRHIPSPQALYLQRLGSQ